MDKYGFLLDDDRCALRRLDSVGSTGSVGSGSGMGSAADSARSLAAATARSETDAKRLEELLDKMHHFNNQAAYSSQPYSNTQSKVKHYARRGLPEDLRQKAWTVLTDVDLLMHKHTGEYQALVDRAEEEWITYELERNVDEHQGKQTNICGTRKSLSTIERDINRTFPKHYLFHKMDEIDDKTQGDNSESKSDDDGIPRIRGDESAHQMVMRLGINCNKSAEDDKQKNISQGPSFNSDSARESDDENDGEENWANFSDDDIANVAQSMGTDAKSIIEEKKLLFNESFSQSFRNLLGPDKIDFSDGDSDDESTVPFSPFHEYERRDSVHSGITNTSFETMGEGEGRGALRRVLRAYSLYDTDIGYCQGMNFITAMFLTFLPEEASFWLLVVVMNEKPYKLRELFAEDMRGTHEVLYLAEKLLAQFLPKLSKHLEAEGIHISMFVTQWLLTLYTSTFPFDLVARVWDSFLLEGWKVIYRVMLSLLEHASDDILEMQFEDILAYVKDFPSRINDAQAIMERSLKIPLKRKHIQKYVTEWRRYASDAEQDDGSNATGSNRAKESKSLFKRRTTSESGDDHSSVSSLTLKQKMSKGHDPAQSSSRSVDNSTIFINTPSSPPKELYHPLRSSMATRTLHESLHRKREQNNKPKPGFERSVSFSSVSIREYERILGDNPSVTAGAPIAIGWRHTPESILIDINTYEEAKGEPRDSSQFLLDQLAREAMIREHTNASNKEIVKIIKLIRKEKAQRLKTVVNLNMQKAEEKAEAAKRKAQRMFNKSLSEEALEAKLWQDAHMIAMEKAKELEESIHQGKRVTTIDLHSVGKVVGTVVNDNGYR